MEALSLIMWALKKTKTAIPPSKTRLPETKNSAKTTDIQRHVFKTTIIKFTAYLRKSWRKKVCQIYNYMRNATAVGSMHKFNSRTKF